jgi:hypothetical protein
MCSVFLPRALPSLLLVASAVSAGAYGALPVVADAERVAQYPKPVAVQTVARVAEPPRFDDAAALASADPAATGLNEAVRITVLESRLQTRLLGVDAPEGQIFVAVRSRWENIHPLQRVERAALEGRPDRTMGVGGFAGGATSQAREYVEMDVPYQVPRAIDHLYAVAGGIAFPLHEIARELPGGLRPADPFTIARRGEVRTIALAFLVPEQTDDVALQFFDYTYGSIAVPLRGDVTSARQLDASHALARAGTDLLDVAVQALSFRDAYADATAPEGWRHAVVRLIGRSQSERHRGQGDIVQLEPSVNAWIVSDGGYVHYAHAGSTDEKGMLRFTPELYQQQEISILVPQASERLQLGLRVRNDVLTFPLTAAAPAGLPAAVQTHVDGDAMEVLLLGHREDGGRIVLDVGIRPLMAGRGLEIRPDQQFFLVADGRGVRIDREATEALPHGLVDTLVVPPGTPVRFEVAFPATPKATAVRVRGFRSQGEFTL